MALSSQEIRSSFIDFFKDAGHTFIPSSPIVPAGDQTLLFANAGMNQFKDIFMGLAEPEVPRAVNSQKCLRVSGKHNDLEEVGKDTYHHTFFEMLGNWSFDDYFKEEAIRFAWDLLTEVWHIDPDRLWATVFAGDPEDGLPPDEEARQLWTKLTTLPAERVLAFGKKDNFWEMGAAGPCGPCSEIHIDLGPDMCDKKHIASHKCGVNAGCSRFIELWNLVFIQFNRAESGKLSPLKAHYIDTGAGLERLAAVLQGKASNYDTDLFSPIMDAMRELCGHRYTSKLEKKEDVAFRVIADHIRSLVFAITDGATPSNEGRGYVIRRILRRACRYGRHLGMHDPFLYKLVPVVVKLMSGAFAEVGQRADYVSMVIQSEEESFGRTLDRGIEIFNNAAKQAKKSGQKMISGQQAFALYDTYGFPFDLTRLMAQERGLEVDTGEFNELMEQQRQRARQGQKQTSLATALADVELPETDDSLKYQTKSCEAKVLAFVTDNKFATEGTLAGDAEAGVVLDRTSFYAESGGQVGDCGQIVTDSAQFAVEDTVKVGNCVIHRGQLAEGTLAVSDTVTAKVSKDRHATEKNHTATHLLQWALQQVLGESVAQQGSLVAPDYLRFDFTYPKALTADQLKQVEQLVRERILADEPVVCSVMPRRQAEQLGAMALFGEKYGSQVRVVALGTDSPNQLQQAFSKEFCGGTHVDSLGKIGDFKILKEESVSAGVLRITATTGRALVEYLNGRSDIVDELTVILKVPAEQVAERVGQLLKEKKKLTKELKAAAKKGGSDVLEQAKKILAGAENIDGTAIVVSQLEDAGVEQARSAVDMIRKKAKSAAVFFGWRDGDKAMLLAAMTDDLVAKGLKAGDIVKAAAAIVGGGGGGRPQMAQAGGKDPEKIGDAVKKANEMIREKLAG